MFRESLSFYRKGRRSPHASFAGGLTLRRFDTEMGDCWPSCESQGICIWVTVRVANEQEMAWVSSIEGKEPVLLLDM